MTIKSSSLASDSQSSGRPARSSWTTRQQGRGYAKLFLILAVLLTCHAATMLGVEVYRYLRSQQDIRLLENDIVLLEHESQQLNLILENQDNPRFREHLARTQGFIFPEERRYITVLLE